MGQWVIKINTFEPNLAPLPNCWIYGFHFSLRKGYFCQYEPYYHAFLLCVTMVYVVLQKYGDQLLLLLL